MSLVSDNPSSHSRNHGDFGGDLSYDSDLAVRNLVRSTLNKAFGSVQGGPYANVSLERDRQQLIDFIVGLRQVTLSLAGVAHVSEGDVLAVCSAIRRMELIGYKNLSFIYEYCARRAHDDLPEAARRDPLLLRHLLTFSIDVPSFDMPPEELSNLEYCLAEGDVRGIEDWFERAGRNLSQLNKGLPNYLRRYLLDHYDASLPAVKTFAFELAVLDVKLSAAIGWENSRSFLAVQCLVQDRRHDPLEAYMSAEDLQTGLLVHQHVGDADGRTYYSLKLDRYNPDDLAALEQLVFATANGSGGNNSGPRGGRKVVAEKRSWWRSLLGQGGVPAHGLDSGAVSPA